MAGKSGLNLTKSEPHEVFAAAYGDMPIALSEALEAFGPQETMTWAKALGQEIFTGSTARVFPKSMKASPLLRAWLTRLGEKGVTLKTGYLWTGWQGSSAVFDTHAGPEILAQDVTVLACGGASWARLGSTGTWAAWIEAPFAPFQPANVGFLVDWSTHMARHFGSPIKPVGLLVDGVTHRGEIVLSSAGLEGGGIYMASAALRDGAALALDLLPDLTHAHITARLSRPQGKASTSTYLRKVLGLSPVKVALLQEYLRPLPKDPASLSAKIKALPIPLKGPRPMDEAISTAGGVAFSGLNDDLMLRSREGTFCAGEMLDWEAPTGGYLLTACLATGKRAGEAAAHWALADQPSV
jgi:uncharacterized flavoprotein (TIGR03862 family)